ncbi:methyltransferase type 11 [Microtetraspora sp. NBRC 13810]|uniref:class I SAM-dependent DNA methyltransferase n=1 Tax=Microtetraspora sp. NBRC 13810 TaxID=3030990 RepID=UPI0024A5655B|nr:class I SAM-dependent methyltransferase [Microtetraspora sp. NBRC 13810]GLW09410.1 methyltransferase type 11 [Microtetraspora sp. NBRC 13810]
MSKRELSGIYHRADLYDAIYRGRGKDYQADSMAIAKHISERNASAASLLDVACGTGSHLRHFAGLFAHVEGVDLAPDMVRLARENLPGVPVHEGDMSGFSLDGTFDAITCLFSSVGYLGDVARLDATLRCFAEHLNPGGVIVLEPWYFPDNATSGSVVGDLVTVGERTISRVSHAVRREGAHHMEVHYLVADRESGIQHFSDTHILSLFDRRQYESAFEKAGCAVEFLAPGESGSGPGLFVGTKPRSTG